MDNDEESDGWYCRCGSMNLPEDKFCDYCESGADPEVERNALAYHGGEERKRNG